MVKQTGFPSADGVRSRVQLRGGQDVHGQEGERGLLQRAEAAGFAAGRWVEPRISAATDVAYSYFVVLGC